jgi:cytochrome c oxidase subunit 3
VSFFQLFHLSADETGCKQSFPCNNRSMHTPHKRDRLGDIHRLSTLDKIEKLHPHKMLLYLIILGSSVIFFFMLIAFTATYTRWQAEVGLSEFFLPKAFILSTLILGFSSFIASHFLRAYRQEKLRKLRNLLGITLGLGLVFTLCQYWGWHELEQSGLSLSGISSGAYLYIISGLHILHLVGGMFFLSYEFIKISAAANDAVRSLILTTNPYEKTRLELLTAYWHYMDLLWLALFLYFLVLY